MSKYKFGDCFVWTGRFAIKNLSLQASKMLSPIKSKFFGTPKVIHAVFKNENTGETVGHAFLQDDKYVYDKISNKNKYRVVEIHSYYKEGLAFDKYGKEIKLKIVSIIEHSFKDLFQLMFDDGGKFGKYGIKTDY